MVYGIVPTLYRKWPLRTPMSTPRSDLAALDSLIGRLRAPDGCPWDREQTLVDLRAYLIEEAHETADAIDQAVETGNFEPLAEELGDLLFQTAFVARLAAEHGAFDHADAVARVYDKMVARHPHVFGEEHLADAEAVRQAWERRKLQQAPDTERRSLLAGVPRSLPALVGAYRLTQKAAGVGFDWPDADGAVAKVREELDEVEDARAALDDSRGRHREIALANLRAEVGDLLFAVANVARKLELDPEAALAAGNRKFRRRFEAVENKLASQSIELPEAGLELMDALWDEVKQDERTATRSTQRGRPNPDDGDVPDDVPPGG